MNLVAREASEVVLARPPHTLWDSTQSHVTYVYTHGTAIIMLRDGNLTDRLLFLLCLLDTLGTRHARLIQPDKNTARPLGPLDLRCLSLYFSVNMTSI